MIPIKGSNNELIVRIGRGEGGSRITIGADSWWHSRGFKKLLLLMEVALPGLLSFG